MRARRAFTLIEMILALLITSIVMTSVASLVFAATKAAPASDGVQSASMEAAGCLTRLSAELAAAKTVTEASPDAVEFTLADWTGDAIDEVVRYEWGNDAGDPVERRVNAGPPEAIVKAARNFALTYDTNSEKVPVGITEDVQTDKIVQSKAVISLVEDGIRANQWLGQIISPSLGASEDSWKLRRIRLWLKQSGTVDGSTIVEIRGVTTGGVPSNAVYASFTINESSLSTTASAVDLYPVVPEIPATTKLALILRPASGASSLDVQFGIPTTVSTTTPGLVSTDSGATWTKSTVRVAKHEVSADVFDRTDGYVVRMVVRRVGVVLENGAAPTRLERSVRMLNSPEYVP